MRRPSSTLIERTALTSSVFASGTAASAARFIAVTSSSTRLLLPGEAQQLGGFVQEAGQRYADLRIAEEAIGATEQLDRGRRAALQRGADAGGGVRLGQVGGTRERCHADAAAGRPREPSAR